MSWPFLADFTDKQVKYVYGLITSMLDHYGLNFHFNDNWKDIKIEFKDCVMMIYFQDKWIEWKVWSANGQLSYYKGRPATYFEYADAYKGIQELDWVISHLKDGPRFFKS